ncbi:Non-reducing end beta-L-arabinofuranosidase [compost metagenome]
MELTLAMPATRMYSHPLVRANAGKVALQRGPLVYCLEQADNGANLHELALPREAELRIEREAGLLGGVVTVQAEAVRRAAPDWNGGLYSASAQLSEQKAALKFIPYYAWANRGEGEMTVWVRER